MNVKDLEEIDELIYGFPVGEGFDSDDRQLMREELTLFVDKIHEKYKPLVEALESIKNEIESDQIQISTFNKFNLLNVLDHYHKVILGESNETEGEKK